MASIKQGFDDLQRNVLVDKGRRSVEMTLKVDTLF